MRQYAGIGSRTLDATNLDICRRLGRIVVKRGHQLHSGNAEGADQAFQGGGNEINPSLVHVHLPWPSFNREALHPNNVIHDLDEHDADTLRAYERLAEKYHPRWPYLKGAVRRLMVRNSSILYPDYPHPVDGVFARPSNKPGGGGTGQGMRLAEGEGIELLNLSQCSVTELYNFLRRIGAE